MNVILHVRAPEKLRFYIFVPFRPLEKCDERKDDWAGEVRIRISRAASDLQMLVTRVCNHVIAVYSEK